jgi:Flp pilus assembly protein TadG
VGKVQTEEQQRMSFTRFWKDRTGSSFIETAILLPAMLMLCCGTMDFARVVYAGIEIANAARAGVSSMEHSRQAIPATRPAWFRRP